MRVVVFPTPQGRFYDYEDWRLVDSVRGAIEAGRMQLFCVDSVDSESLYGRHRPPCQRIARHRQYVDYIIHEVTPFTASKNPCPAPAVHGCSIGAYHAVNVAFRRPDLFSEVVAFSGRYDLTRNVATFGDLFEGYYDQEIYLHTPTHFLPGLREGVALEHMRRLDVTITIGEHDPFLDSSCELSRILHEKGVPYRLLVWDGEAHRAHYWRRMAQLYLTGC